MKTMMEILIRLQQLRRSSLRFAQNKQLTAAEKNSVRCLKNLVRECLPAKVLVHYDQLKETEPELLKCPEVFAMAVLVATYRELSAHKRKKLVMHFAIPTGPACHCNGRLAVRGPQAHGRRRLLSPRQLTA